MDRPASQVHLGVVPDHLVAAAVQVVEHRLQRRDGASGGRGALAAPATASGIARAAIPVRASTALRENDMGNSIHIRPAPVADLNRAYAPTPPPVLGAVARSG
jgi:hypothetical protein